MRVEQRVIGDKFKPLLRINGRSLQATRRVRAQSPGMKILAIGETAMRADSCQTSTIQSDLATNNALSQNVRGELLHMAIVEQDAALRNARQGLGRRLGRLTQTLSAALAGFAWAVVDFWNIPPLGPSDLTR